MQLFHQVTVIGYVLGFLTSFALLFIFYIVRRVFLNARRLSFTKEEFELAISALQIIIETKTSLEILPHLRKIRRDIFGTTQNKSNKTVSNTSLQDSHKVKLYKEQQSQLLQQKSKEIFASLSPKTKAVLIHWLGHEALAQYILAQLVQQISVL